jgi:hypothetical protein
VASERQIGPVNVSWAFIVGVDDDGNITLIDHDDAMGVKAKRVASLDDIYAASVVGAGMKNYWLTPPSEDAYTLAFVVFQTPEGYVAASPNIFENIVPAKPEPGQAQIKGAFGVLQGQIIAQKTADAIQMVGAMAAAAKARAADPEAAKKSAGGLYVA